MRSTTATFRVEIERNRLCSIIWRSYVSVVQERGMKFVESEELKSNIEAVADWMRSPKRCFLYISSLYGSGKTTLMEAISRAVDLLGLKDGEIVIRLYDYSAKEIMEMARDEPTTYKKLSNTYERYMVGIDDLGIEPVEIMEYGNVRSPIVDLLETRYKKRLPTIITSNLKADEIGRRYGERIADRFREIAQSLVINQESYRKRGQNSQV